ncbi:hypothetical protein [Planotetraspora kaengkrachanensis]|uniref:Uncharacterized protein n=1 Tax=Planotetraspora kaengkrachanensis TaxID=575193 RepID=A0A8J3PYH3_9ACTN|nr:hypothetical protein [Planotetraspora kaengkrachanensis]GIG83315.1 hypothetical protein Pka01_64420 [Planotetraspora kaengkrachanensis]
MKFFRKIITDVKARRHIEAYVVTLVVGSFAVVSVVDDIVPLSLKWAALLSGVGLLVYRITLPEDRDQGGDFLHDRASFDSVPISVAFANARDIRVFAPSAVNLLSPHACEILRTSVLNRRGGSVRVVILDPRETEAVKIASRQLDQSVRYQIQNLPGALESMIDRLGAMSGWQVAGSFGYRLFPYNPGFSLVIIDPETTHGRVIVEIHGFRNQSTFARMHLELTRERNERWYSYWIEQFESLWDAAAVTQRPAVSEQSPVDTVEAPD